MKFSNSDFRLMRWNLAAFAAAITLGGAMLYGSQQYAAHIQRDFRAAQAQMNDARNRLATAQQDRENLNTYFVGYQAMEARRLIGDDHRLDWMEGLDRLHHQNLVAGFSYNIAPQKVYAPQPAVDSGNFELHYSEMKLQFDLLHEGQLLNFFNALRKQIKGHYQLESCAIQRSTDAGGADDDDDESATSTANLNLKAECSGGWITLKNRNTP